MIRAALAALLATSVFVVPGLAQQGAGHSHVHGTEVHGQNDHSRHEGGAHGVRAVHAWARATTGGEALIFVDIENTSEKDIVLVGIEADWAGGGELVGFQMKDGEAGYVVLPQVPVKAGTEMTLAPNGLALRLTGIERPLVAGEEVAVEIEFDFGHVEMVVQVEAEDARGHSHAGHAH